MTFDAGRYVGLPFGDGPGAVTCWSLVSRIYGEALRIDLPEFGDIDPRDLVRVARKITAGAADTVWRAVDVPEALDVVLMRSARGGAAICHVGVVIDAQTMLHAEETTGVVAVPMQHFTVRHRIAGFRRYQG